MLLSRDAIAVAVEEVSAEDFYKPSHAHIFSAVTSLYSRGEPADAVTVAEEMRRHGTLDTVGGASALISLQANTPAISSVSRYARIVQEHAVLRRLIAVAYEIAEIGYELPADVVAAVDRAEAMVFDVAQHRSSDSTRALKDLLAESLDHLEYLNNLGETITGVATGYRELDHELYGLQPSNLVVVGARPSMGKTAFALGLAAHAARIGVPEHDLPVLFEGSERLLGTVVVALCMRYGNGQHVAPLVQQRKGCVVPFDPDVHVPADELQRVVALHGTRQHHCFEQYLEAVAYTENEPFFFRVFL
jgi:replicative DNA helicase